MLSTREDLNKLDGLDLLMLLVYGESRGESLPGMVAVAWTVRNRVMNPRWWGNSWKTVILKNKQFSCFNENDPNLKKIIDKYNTGWINSEKLRLCRWVAAGVINKDLPDYSQRANHYHTESVEPAWADHYKIVSHIGSHIFYRL